MSLVIVGNLSSISSNMVQRRKKKFSPTLLTRYNFYFLWVKIKKINIFYQYELLRIVLCHYDLCWFLLVYGFDKSTWTWSGKTVLFRGRSWKRMYQCSPKTFLTTRHLGQWLAKVTRPNQCTLDRRYFYFPAPVLSLTVFRSTVCTIRHLFMFVVA
jgi:hypothetical protein